MRVSRFTAEFKAEAIKQVIDRGHSVVDFTKRLGRSYKSLFQWLRQAKEPQGVVVGFRAIHIGKVHQQACALVNFLKSHKRASPHQIVLSVLGFFAGNCGAHDHFAVTVKGADLEKVVL